MTRQNRGMYEDMNKTSKAIGRNVFIFVLACIYFL